MKPRHRRPPTTLAFVLLAMALTIAPFGGTKRDSHAGRDSGTALAPPGQPLGQAALTSGSEYDGLAGATSWAGERIAARAAGSPTPDLSPRPGSPGLHHGGTARVLVAAGPGGSRAPPGQSSIGQIPTSHAS